MASNELTSNRKNIILMLISIEIMLLAVTLLVIISSFGFDDILGQTYSVYIIAIAGAESAIGLGILVAYYRLIIVVVASQQMANNLVDCWNVSL